MYPFPTVFPKDLYCRHVKTRACFGKGQLAKGQCIKQVLPKNFWQIYAPFFTSTINHAVFFLQLQRPLKKCSKWGTSILLSCKPQSHLDKVPTTSTVHGFHWRSTNLVRTGQIAMRSYCVFFYDKCLPTTTNPCFWAQWEHITHTVSAWCNLKGLRKNLVKT